MFVLVYLVLPPMRAHLAGGRPAINLWDIFIQPMHGRAYLLTTALVFSSFILAPYLASYLVANVGLANAELPYVYLSGGLVTLGTMTLFGWMSDRYGKLPMFRSLALFNLLPILLVTNLPAVSLAMVLAIFTLFMVISSGRMVPAMALITASATPQNRGGFLSVNASVQQAAAGLASALGGLMLGQGANGEIMGFSLVGAVACAATLATVWLAGRLRTADGGEDAVWEG